MKTEIISIFSSGDGRDKALELADLIKQSKEYNKYNCSN